MLNQFKFCGPSRWLSEMQRMMIPHSGSSCSTLQLLPRNLVLNTGIFAKLYFSLISTILLLEMLRTNVLKTASDYLKTFKILFHEKHRGASKGQHDSVLFTLSHIWAWSSKKMGYLRGRTRRNSALKRKEEKKIGRSQRKNDVMLPLQGVPYFCFIHPAGIF